MSTTNTNTQNTTSTPVTLNKYGFITPEKKGSRPATFTKDAWDHSTYNAYIAFIKVIEGEMAQDRWLKRAKQLFNACGMPADDYHYTLLLLAVAHDTTANKEKVHKVSAISSFRQFFNGGWIERESRKTVANAGKNPGDAPAVTKAKDPTKDQLKAQLAEQKKLIEELKAKLAEQPAA